MKIEPLPPRTTSNFGKCKEFHDRKIVIELGERMV
jgi:hypothetical protein